ncbi:hypothetical protein LCGC14_1545670 [marine sediment metagenome]|uniref:Histidine kinase N-terminal 7TM region domain-containing protein n=1 Tax=marine sediment metagenome TaxID=412755 RepID=A0A0F9LSK4_9ZZZZ|nr:hypothetical protein [archaeon]HEC37446.1 hypothetical protein [bacterium]
MAIGWEGWLGGTTASLIVFSSVIFGFFSLYKSIKLKAKLLSVAGIAMIFVGFLWLGPTIDFFLKLTTDTNISPVTTYVLLSYTSVAPALFFAVYLGAELLIPKYKWLLVGIFIVMGAIFEFFLWTQPNIGQSFEFIEVIPAGDGLIDAGFNRRHPTFIMVAIFLVSALIFLGIGFALKAKQSTGLLRKKFTYLSIGFIIFVLSGALDSIIDLPLAIGIIRVVMSSFALFMYLGLKT